jgi:hypothetical protein
MNMATQFSLPLRCSAVTISRIAPFSRLDEDKICLPNSYAIHWTRHSWYVLALARPYLAKYPEIAATKVVFP